METENYLTFKSPEYLVTSVGGRHQPLFKDIHEGDRLQFVLGGEGSEPVVGKKQYVANRLHVYHNGEFKSTIYGKEITQLLETYELKTCIGEQAGGE